MKKPLSSLLPADVRVLERGWLSSNNIVCLGDAPAIIDTGHVKHAEQTVALLREQLGAQPLATIAHTHLHSDHCGGTGALQNAWSETGSSTLVPFESLPHVQAWDEDKLTFGNTGQRCERFLASHALVPGETVRLGHRNWEIHAAPGHDALAVLLFEPAEGLLIAGDAMWENGVGVIFPQIDGSQGRSRSHQGSSWPAPQEPEADCTSGLSDWFDPFVETLALIEQLAPRVVIPGHGAPFSRESGAMDAAFAAARQRIKYFKDHPAQHALYAAKVMIKYQLMDAESMPHRDFEAWLHAAPMLRVAHRQHRPDLTWSEWLDTLLESLFDKGTLRRTATHVLNGH